MEGTWTVDLSSAPGSVYEGAAKTKPGCTLTLDDDDLVALTTGKLDAMKAFMGGKLKVFFCEKKKKKKKKKKRKKKKTRTCMNGVL